MRASQGRCSGCGRACTVGCVRPAYCSQECEDRAKARLDYKIPEILEDPITVPGEAKISPAQAQLDLGLSGLPLFNTQSD